MDGGLPDKLKIARTSTVDQVAHRLRDLIWSGQLPPDLRLREVSLAKSFGVSRNTVRDAIRLLANQGLVCHELHRGAVVASLSPDDIVDLYRVRRVIELQAIMEPRPGPERLDTLLAAVEGMEHAAAARDWEQLAELDIAFHVAITGLLKSERMDRFFEQVSSEFRHAVGILTFEDGRAVDQPSEAHESFAEFEDPAEIAAEHRRIYSDAAAGRRREAKKQLRAHLDRNEKRLLGIIRMRGKDGAEASNA